MTNDESADEVGLPTPDPAWAAHFKDPLYREISDDRTPFGSDEGADMLDEWAGMRDELGPESTVSQILEGDGSGFTIEDAIADPDDSDAQGYVKSAGFVLLYLTGHIDKAGRDATLKALDNQIRIYGADDPVLARQRQDLQSWTE